MEGAAVKFPFRLRLCAMLFALAPCVACAGGPFGIDHEWSLDENGIWARNYQTSLEYGRRQLGLVPGNEATFHFLGFIS